MLTDVTKYVLPPFVSLRMPSLHNENDIKLVQKIWNQFFLSEFNSRLRYSVLRSLRILVTSIKLKSVPFPSGSEHLSCEYNQTPMGMLRIPTRVGHMYFYHMIW